MIIYTVIATLVISISLLALVLGMEDRKDGFTNQLYYWTFYICGLIGLSMFIGKSVLSIFPTLNIFLVPLFITIALFALTQSYVIVTGDPNLVFATKDSLFPRKVSGKKLYRLYEGKMSLKLPWHTQGVEVNIYDKEEIDFSELTVEMKGVVLKVKGSAIIKPIGTGDKIQAMLQTDLDEKERIKKISNQIKSAITSALGDELIFENEDGSMRFNDAESVMNDKAKYVAVVEKNTTLMKTCDLYGYELESLILSDIDESADSSKSREQVAVAKHLNDAVLENMVCAGYAVRDERTGKITKKDVISEEEWRKAIKEERKNVNAAAGYADIKYIIGEGLGDKTRVEASAD